MPALCGVWRELPRHQHELVEHPLAQGSLRDLAQLPAQVAQHAPGVAFQRPECLAHALELPGMGVAADLRGEPGRQARIALPQFDAGLPREIHQLGPGPLNEPAVRRVSDGLFHDGRVHHDLVEAPLRHRARFAASFDGRGRAATRHPPPRCACASGSARTDRWARGAGRTPPR